MFPRLALLPIGLFIIWCFVCRQWYVCHIKQVCEGPPVVVVDTPVVDVPDTRPLVFNWKSPDPVTRPTFQAYRDSILKTVTDTSLLVITGQYLEGEPAPAGFANMGLARGEAVKALFAQFLPADRITVKSEMIPKPPDAETKPFLAATFSTKPIEKPGGPVVVECIAGKDNSLTVYFPYGKAQREVDIKIEECLQDIIKFLKANPEKKVSVTGHTDDAGTAEFNMGLGMRRAEHIQGILFKNGISKDRITVATKGESEPVASNDTEEGTRLNRRAVIVVTN